MESNISELLIQTGNGTMEVRGSRGEMTELFNILLMSRKNGETTLVVNTPSGYPMMFDPQTISHMAVVPK